MNHLPENERLGAYLDGELTAAERAEVERLLAADPSARQLVEELRTLRTTLQELPPLSIGRSIRNEVLGRVEQPKATLAPRPPTATRPRLAPLGAPWPGGCSRRGR